MAKILLRLLACTSLAAVFSVSAVYARPPHKASVIRYYGDRLPKQFQSCNLCHLSDTEVAELKPSIQADEKKPWNAFGRALRDLGKSPASGASQPGPIIDRVRQLAGLDADGDGVPNEVEMFAGTSPGSSSIRPEGTLLAAAQESFRRFHASDAEFVWKPFAPVERPQIPDAASPWVQNPIDAFIAAEHKRLGLQPRPPADPEVLLRRAYLDLIGLPPTRAELVEFLGDPSLQAFEDVVDRLLASPRYGERWGRHWMDIWRYSDWAGWGQQVRDSQPHIWHWRDWIIESLNADKGYDQMVLEMLAADELAPTDRQALRATGFLVRNFKLLSREQWMTETVDHVTRALLGVTVKCAQCHDHMYDLVSQDEYFHFRAIFEPHQVRTDPLPGELEPAKGGVVRVYDAQLDAPTYFYVNGDERKADKSKPLSAATPVFLGGGELKAQPVELPLESWYPAMAPFVIEEMLASARSKVETAKAALAQEQSDLAKARLVAAEAQLASLQARITAEQAKYRGGERLQDAITPLSQSASKAERAATLAAANVTVVEAEVQANKPGANKAEESENAKKARAEAEKKVAEARKSREAALAASKEDSDKYSAIGPTYPLTSTGRRLALARWIADTRNPLTARVAVNHIWARHFGRGLVPSTDDLGENRQEPTHAALLDWLAAELMQPSDGSHAWSMKRLHRLIVLSNTYRTASTNDPTCFAIDPDNRFLWRTSPRRVEAEVIRDSVLHVAGSLDLTQGGPDLDQTQGLKTPRRSLYFRSAPEKQMLFLQLFDMAAPTECYQRRESVVPQQALALANSELTVREARRLARQLNQTGPPSLDEYIATAFQQILSRLPTDAEEEQCAQFVATQARRFSEGAARYGDATAKHDDLQKPASDPSLRARENLVHVLLNHHEFVSIR